jgi:hypothetical protein
LFDVVGSGEPPLIEIYFRMLLAREPLVDLMIEVTMKLRGPFQVVAVQGVAFARITDEDVPVEPRNVSLSSVVHLAASSRPCGPAAEIN